MNDYSQKEIENDEISIKDLILLIKKYFFVLLRKWWLIGIFGILVGGYFYYSASKQPTTYSAELTYTSGEGNSLGGVGGLLGGFLGRGRSNPLAKAQAMAKTQKIGKTALFTKVYIDDTLDYLINHHGRIYEFEEFVPFKDNLLSTKKERKVFKTILSIINKAFFTQSIDEETGIASMSINTLSEDYSIELTKTYYESLVDFYKKTEVGQQQKTLNALQNRADSIYGVIQSTAYGIARIKDQDKGIFWAVDRVPETQATTELTFLTSAYQEVVKNLETLKFTVASNTPSISAIDYPTTPLKPQKESKLIKALIGAFIGCFLASLFILGRQIIADIMADDDENHLIPD